MVDKVDRPSTVRLPPRVVEPVTPRVPPTEALSEVERVERLAKYTAICSGAITLLAMIMLKMFA